MNITEHSIAVEKTARYCTNDPEYKKIKSSWFVIHGYAQLAKDFIQEFDFLSGPDSLIVAPEGLSKFYSKSIPAASWMTREDRDNEIEDYLKYLEKVFKEVNESYDITSSEINLLGFSQGVHTAVRWFIKSRYHIDKLILCSSDFPKDADFSGLKEKLSGAELYCLYGTNDRIISLSIYEEDLEMLRSKGIHYKQITFDGDHVIDPEAVLKITSADK